MLSDAERALLRQDEVEMLERAKKSTPGPWCWESVAEKSNEFIVGVGCDERGNYFNGKVPKDEWVEDAIIERRTFVGSNESGNARFADASFIAHARTDVPELLGRLAAARAGERWIPVTERLPEESDGNVLTLNNFGTMMVGQYADKDWYTASGSISENNASLLPRSLTPVSITHWRPLPSPPAESETK